MRGILLSLMAIAFVLALFGCSSRKEIECEVFKIKDFDSKIATKAKDNVDYILIESHEEYFELLSDNKIVLNNPGRFDEEFFEKNMLIFIEFRYSIGVIDLQATTYLEKKNLVINLHPTFDFSQYFSGQRIGIILEKIDFKDIIIE